MASARKLLRSESEEREDAMHLHEPNLSLLLCPEILERIGKKLDSLPAAGRWNSVFARRYHGLMRLMHDYPDMQYANVIPMINIDLIHGKKIYSVAKPGTK